MHRGGARGASSGHLVLFAAALLVLARHSQEAVLDFDPDLLRLGARQIHADDQIVVMAHKIDCRHPSAVISPAQLVE